MAHQWEMEMGIDYGMGMGASFSHNSSFATNTPMNSARVSSNPAYLYGKQSHTDSLRVDDLLDFSKAHEIFPSGSAMAMPDNGHLIPVQGDQSQTVSARNSVSSSDLQSYHHSYADEFYIPSEEAAELEWLSKFVDDSYCDMPYAGSSGAAAVGTGSYIPQASEASQLGGADNSSASNAGRGARSKRSRATALSAAAAWHSLVPPPQSSPSSSSSSSDFPSTKPSKGNSANRGKKGAVNGAPDVGLEGGVRRCTHCASEKTPQWRTGPLGPKTLCNACGVRYKSGRLMPEYRPAASPTFVLTQHSNSHRKVMELRRQKEMLLLRHRDNPSVVAAAAAANAAAGRPELLFHDYGVC